MLFVTLFKWAARCGAVTIAGVAAGLLFEACAGSPPSTAAPSPVVSTQSAPTVVSVAVSGTAPLAGATTQFSATATLSDGTTQSVTNAASWSSSNSSIASVSASGAVTGVAAGDADITATHQTISGKARVTVVRPAPSTPSLNLTGTWTGSGSDGLGPETFTWVVVQSGDAVSGSVSMRPLSLTDGSCASCHKVKDGSISGSVSGTAVTLRMSFALGGSQPTPTCLVIMDVSASGVTSTSLVSSYSGSDSCEPAVALGSMAMTRQ